MKIHNLTNKPYAQAKVIELDDGTIQLISYTTTVANITPEGYVTLTGLYSMTTRKHISAFAKEWCRTDYQTLKACYENGEVYRI